MVISKERRFEYLDPRGDFVKNVEEKMGQDDRRRAIKVMAEILNTEEDSREIYVAIFPNISTRKFNADELLSISGDWINKNIGVERAEAESDSAFNEALEEKQQSYKNAVKVFIDLLYLATR